METSPHVNRTGLVALVELSGLPRTHVAAQAQVTAPQFSDLLSGRRLGSSDDVRARIADALEVPVGAVTCWCDRPDGVCRNQS